jgi:hypothetical protein
MLLLVKMGGQKRTRGFAKIKNKIKRGLEVPKDTFKYSTTTLQPNSPKDAYRTCGGDPILFFEAHKSPSLMVA